MRKFLISMIALLTAAVTYAYDFTAECSSGQTLAYTIIDASAKTCEVAQPDVKPSGEVVIDATVVNPDDSETYTVIGVGYNAFYTASNVTKVTFPTAATFTYIGNTTGDHSFRNSGLVGKLIIPDNVTKLGGHVFYETKITEIQFGTGLTDIGTMAFKGCQYLTHVELPNAVTTIGSQSFSSCYNLTYFQMGSNVTTVLGNSFDYDTKLDTIVVKATTPPDLGYATPQATLTNSAILYVPAASVSAYKAHEKWGKFKFIAAEGTPVSRFTFSVANNVFSGINSKCYVYVNGTSLSNANSIKCTENEVCHVRLQPQRWWAMESVKLNDVDITSQFVDNEADVTVTEDVTLTVKWYQPELPYDFTETVQSGQLLYFTITDDVNHKVKIVNQSGGRGYGGTTDYGYIEWNEATQKWVESSDLPKGDLIVPATIQHEGVTYTIAEIDTSAFVSTDITSVTFTEGLKKIGASAFYECTSLRGKIFIPQSCTSLGEWAFRSTKITEIYTGGAEELPQYLTLYCDIVNIKSTPATKYIRNYFQNDNYALRTIEIGENVERVGSYAFYSCSYVTKVICYATTPPVMKDRPSDSESTSWGYFPVGSMTLYVPKGTKSAYEAANCWKLFGTIVEMEDTYTISTAVAGTGLGSVTGAGRYESGVDTILTAIPALHYQFVQWSDGNTDNPRRITVTGDATYTAEFAPRPTQVGDVLEQLDHNQFVRYEVTSIAPNEVKLIDNGNHYRYIASDWTIPGTVTDYWGESFTLTRLAELCLYNTSGIDTLRIPEGVRVVENSALYNSYCFKKWYFPSTIDSIYGNNATYCSSLQDIRFAGTENLRYIDVSTLSYETSSTLKNNTPNNSFCVRDGVALFFKGTTPTMLEVPEGVKIVGYRVLSYYSVGSTKYVRLPSTLKLLCDQAFYQLPSACQTIYLKTLVPPTVAKAGVFSYEDNKKVVVPCDANINTYKEDAYWSTLDTVVAGAPYLVTVERVNNYGSYSVEEPTCGTAHIVATPNQYYVVDEWSTGEKDVNEIDVVLTQDTTITVKFKYESYTVRFLDWDGSEVAPSIKVQRNNYVPTPLPDLPNTKTGYTSDEWIRSDGYGTSSWITQDVDFIAHYSPNTYHIVFKNWDGTILQEYDRKYDEFIYYNQSTPTRPENDTCKYFFEKWVPDVVIGTTLVTGDAEYTAMFRKEYKTYTVTFYNWNGDKLDEQTGLHLGDVLTYKGVAPTKPSTAQYEYEFTGWSPEFVDGVTQVSKSVNSYTAQFEQKTRKYLISFLNYNDELLWSNEFAYGVTPEYGGEMPLRPATDTCTYTFREWTPEIVAVTRAATYKAIFTKAFINYTVRFIDYDDSQIAVQENLHFGDVITYTEIPTRDPDIQYIYTFDKWDPEFESGVTKVSGNMTFKATYSTKTQKYTVTFLAEEGGAVIGSVTVAYGLDATAGAPDVTDITPADKRFGGWSQDITNVQGNMTVWPIWKDKIYTVQFIDPLDNNRVIEEYEDVPYGGSVIAPNAPVHDGYIFIGWDSEAYKNVTDDLIIRAVYEQDVTGLNNIETETTATKFIEDGKLFIRRGDKIFNANGALVK